MSDLEQFSSALTNLVDGQVRNIAAEQEYRQFRKQVLQALLQTGADNYKENARIAGVIEDKAQKAGAVAGIFLAAGLAFVKPGMNLGQVGGKLGFGLLSISIALLLICIAFCLAVMWARSGRLPVLLSDLKRMKCDLFALSPGELTPELQEGFSLDQSLLWAQITEDQIHKNRKKALLLRRAQGTLVIAMSIVGIFLFLLLLRAYKTPTLLSI